MNKHTPGPWIAVDHAHYPGMMVVEGPEMPITIITSAIGVDFDSHMRRIANAHLIAAAPDLLEALVGLLENERQSSFEYWLSVQRPSGDCDAVHSQWLESSGYHDFLDLYDSEIAAIAKARGEA